MELIKQHVLNFLKTNKLMSVATFGSYPWIANVYYVFDDEMNLYFLSGEKTLHCQQISQNEKVAVAIVDSHQGFHDKQIGLQMWGIAKKVSDLEKLRYVLGMWKQALNEKDDNLSAEHIINNVIKSRVYRISPKRIKIFSKQLFSVPTGEEPVLEL
ncbi:MAG: hypothetical protein A2418_03300 [Candidatus Brennerbacteria bacterium RIFOXYC1_FULL_41_11]|uniref:Pyridoxamine 5'-phosphate oxidase N-terminal domain-containing protein n=1 Tax=Candidatus Brennerbacteria bacterium RIFOXYD1_FULL_41_16 TaxID=1797529 RepID=A0A1G1XMV8_9BACT|nr:MAG: hypothetical protein A2391_00980 [Candidatus Brennerbacteria bacterium RIFOXYB1_FULL_41_13]OGY40104.1 MAG: hypothetical protein A2418_03300 [Candidatus Brennerbacteria bacterium RIFOXYC1_FULL_41_11]OGY40667.1 MAG: hypothetical protein A2570_00845 [Candidatus Brennerbacteria bacterium RIFOXYD1_FULL_41_16]